VSIDDEKPRRQEPRQINWTQIIGGGGNGKQIVGLEDRKTPVRNPGEQEYNGLSRRGKNLPKAEGWREKARSWRYSIEKG